MEAQRELIGDKANRRVTEDQYYFEGPGAKYPESEDLGDGEVKARFADPLTDADIAVRSEIDGLSGNVSSIRPRGTAKDKLLLSASDNAAFTQSIRNRDFVAERVAEIMEEVHKNPALARKYKLLLLDEAKTDWMHSKSETLSGYEMERLCVTLSSALKALPKYKPMAYTTEPHRPQFEIGKRNEGGFLSGEPTWLIKQTHAKQTDPLEAEANRQILGKSDMPKFTFKAKELFQQSGRSLVKSPPKQQKPIPQVQKFQVQSTETKVKPFLTKFFIPDCKTMKAMVAKDMSLGTEPSAQITTFRDEITPQELGKEEFVLSFKVQYEDVQPLDQRKTKVQEEAEVKAEQKKEADIEKMLRTCFNGRERSEFNPQVRPVHKSKQVGTRDPHVLLERELYKGVFDIE